MFFFLQAFLIRQAGKIPTIADPSIFEDLTEWERQREEDEFARVTLLFRQKGADDIFDQRFTRGEQKSSGLLFAQSPMDVRLLCFFIFSALLACTCMVLTGVRLPQLHARFHSSSGGGATERRPRKPVREVYDWEPCALLCKRFQVMDPYESSGVCVACVFFHCFLTLPP